MRNRETATNAEEKSSTIDDSGLLAKLGILEFLIDSTRWLTTRCLGYRQEFKREFSILELFGFGFSITAVVPSVSYAT
jgi:hypothetical protein